MIELRETTLWYQRKRGWLSSLFPGTPDLVRVWAEERVAAITDWKFIRKPITAVEANEQLRAYVVMVDDTFPSLNLEHVYGALIAPRIFEKPHIVEYQRADIDKARAEINAAWDASHKDGAPRNASEAACGFCTAKLICKEYRAWVGEVETLKARLPVSQWTEEQINLFLSRRRELLNFIESAYEQLKELKALDPEAVPGWYLKDGNDIQHVVSIVAAYRALVLETGVCTDQQFSDSCKISLPEIARIIWAHRYNTEKRITQEQARELVTRTLGEIIVLKKNAPSLAQHWLSKQEAKKQLKK